MKTPYRAIIVVLFCALTVFAKKSLEVSSIADFQSVLSNQEVLQDKLTITFNGIKDLKNHEDEFLNLFKVWKGKALIHGLVFRNLDDLHGAFITNLVTELSDSQLVSLNVENVDYSGDLLLPKTKILYGLKKLSIINTDLDEDFFKNLNKSMQPNLCHLALIKCDLSNDQLLAIKNTHLLPNLKYLDLSQNDFGNYILSIFPYQQQGKLITLKLNNVGLVLSSGENYNSNYPAVNRKIDPEYGIKWNSPYFSCLKHLELQHVSENMKEILSFEEDSIFQALPVFMGFVPDVKPTRSIKGKFKNKQLLDIFFKNLYSLNFHSTRNNYSFDSPQHLNLFLKSRQAKISENIILNGPRWNYMAVCTLLESNKLPALDEMFLPGNSMTQQEIKRLIDAFSGISFDVILSHAGGLWPGVSE